jgi:uncharacterized protein YndB with AHSA1/START domain
MAVKKEADGRRWVAVEVELPGTPEQVWQAIATGQGISSWFCPTQVEERVGGKMVFEIMPGMESPATITAWEAPRRLAAEDPGWAPGMPPVATEWTVEARAGGTCLVRVVHSLFASTDDWDSQLEGTESGWPGCFRILRMYLTTFRGQRCSLMRAVAMAGGEEPDAWRKISDGLGVKGLAAGERWAAGAGAPPLAGTVEGFSEAKEHHDFLVRLEQPAPGMAWINSANCGGAVMVSMICYLYGDAAAEVAKRDEPLWRDWMSKQFPQTEAGAAGGA